MDGKLKVDEFITHRQPLAKINQAFDDMKAGDCIRCGKYLILAFTRCFYSLANIE